MYQYCYILLLNSNKTNEKNTHKSGNTSCTTSCTSTTKSNKKKKKNRALENRGTFSHCRGSGSPSKIKGGEEDHGGSTAA
ncbi:hypothetical protein EMCRGX_G015339 [Ephydatia muelleri]